VIWILKYVLYFLLLHKPPSSCNKNKSGDMSFLHVVMYVNRVVAEPPLVEWPLINQNATRISSAIEKGISHLPIFTRPPFSISQQLYIIVSPVGVVVGERRKLGRGSVTAYKGYVSFCLGFVMRSLHEVDAYKREHASSTVRGRVSSPKLLDKFALPYIWLSYCTPKAFGRDLILVVIYPTQTLLYLKFNQNLTNFTKNAYSNKLLIFQICT
jgi:hypothetical protein